MVAQTETAAYLQLRQYYERGEYEKLADSTSVEQLMTACGTQPPSVILHKRLQWYYTVLAHRARSGSFPQIPETAMDVGCFAPSRFIFYQSIEKWHTDFESVDALVELAYLVDRDWEDDWQRGYAAFKQGQRYRGAGDVVAARQAFEVAVKSLRNSGHENAIAYTSWGMQALGDLALGAGDFGAASVFYRESIGQSPRDGGAGFEGLVRVWEEQGRGLEYAVQQFEKLRDGLSTQEPWLTSGAAHALLEVRAFAEARQLIRSAPDEVQNAAPVLGVQGDLYQAVGNMEKARWCYAEALSLFLPEDPLRGAANAAALAKVLVAQGHPDEAIAFQELAVELNPSAEWYWYGLGQLHEDLGQADGARLAYEAALALDPDSAAFQTRLDELGQ